jgi:single-strand DNA-binding protein
MRTVNKVILIGNITKDPLIKTTETGKKIALYTIATNRSYKTAE